MGKGVFLEPWAWLALGHRKDTHHMRVKKHYEELRRNTSRLYTSDFVLDEVITLIFRRENYDEAVRFAEGIFKAAESRQLIIERITSDRFISAWKLRKRFSDKPKISFTDITSMVLMKEQGIESIFTEDDHFIQVGMGFQKVI